MRAQGEVYTERAYRACVSGSRVFHASEPPAASTDLAIESDRPDEAVEGAGLLKQHEAISFDEAA